MDQYRKEVRTEFRCSLSLVRVSEGDGWVSELPSASNKYLTPITLVVSPPIHQTRPSGSDFRLNLKPAAGRFRTDSGGVV